MGLLAFIVCCVVLVESGRGPYYNSFEESLQLEENGTVLDEVEISGVFIRFDGSGETRELKFRTEESVHGARIYIRFPGYKEGAFRLWIEGYYNGRKFVAHKSAADYLTDNISIRYKEE